MPIRSFTVATEAELLPAADWLAGLTNRNRLFYFEGGMGAGKTALIRAMCRSLGVQDGVTSPTFALVNEYVSPQGPVFHFDLYRLRTPDELHGIGYEDYFSGDYLCLVEWPSMAGGLLPPADVTVRIIVEGETREIVIAMNDER